MESIFELRRRARVQIETEEQIDKRNPFSPDVGFHAVVVPLSGSIHHTHNAPVSLAHTAFTMSQRYSL